jgi:hypothetical protein
MRYRRDLYPECGGMGSMHVTLDVLKPPTGEGRLFFQKWRSLYKEILKKTVNCSRGNKSLPYNLNGNLLRVRDKWNRCVKVIDHYADNVGKQIHVNF